ncbi:MAG: FadR family transcriptional regulator [Spirochaetaceae bacterium]|nr:MAG: FadR family transcriptional regulator [Spirochaetaceae bacterium]
MKVVEPIKRTRVPEEVALAIEKIIIDNNLQPGDRLPSQMELSRTLNVGTRSVREAIKTLEARGLIETHQGKGIYIKSNNLDYFLEVLNDSLIFDIYKDRDLLLELTDVRKMIETNVIYEVARKPGKELLQMLLEIFDNMEKAFEAGQNVAAYNLLDVKFHKTIIGASGNKIIITLYKYLSNLLKKSVTETGYMEGSLEEGFQDHRLIIEALVGRNPQRAKELMEKHILSTREKLQSLLM